MQKENTLLQASFIYFPFLPRRDTVDGCTEILGEIHTLSMCYLATNFQSG